MNRERNGKLLTARNFGANLAASNWSKNQRSYRLRPDGGVVTQGTANPLPRPAFRGKLAQFQICSVRRFPRAFAPTANRDRIAA